MYETLTEFERALARFGDKVQLIVGLEINNKMSPETAYQEIKDMMKDLKKLRKKEKETWEKPTLLNEDNKKYIYESPDGGKTVYRRQFGDYTERELIKSDDF